MPPTIEIIPAILPASFKDLQKTLTRLQGVAPRVQVDVVDGVYAHAKTWPYKDSGTFETIVKEERGLPFWESLDYQFDLMIADPAAEIERYVSAGATQVVIHTNSPSAEAALQRMVDKRDEMGSYPVQVGVAVGVDTQPDVLEPFEAQFDFVQVMGIAREGRQGEPFNIHALYLLERLRARYPSLPLQVDGGVTKENVRQLVLAGATRLVVGSALWKEEDPGEAYRTLYTEANH